MVVAAGLRQRSKFGRQPTMLTLVMSGTIGDAHGRRELVHIVSKRSIEPLD
jgi:hypothetical protein